MEKYDNNLYRFGKFKGYTYKELYDNFPKFCNRLINRDTNGNENYIIPEKFKKYILFRIGDC